MSILSIILALVLSSGNPNSYKPKVVNKPFPALELRDSTKNYIIIHYDSSPSVAVTLKYLRKKKDAYHYLIDRVGTVIKLIDPKYQARHAGISDFDGHHEMNKYSIGICLTNSGLQPYTDAQYKSLAWLVLELEHRYPDIRTKQDIVGHSDIASPRGRKHDPGPQFDWESLYAEMYRATLSD